MDLIACEFCKNPEEIMDMHPIEDMLICGYCIQKVDMLTEFLCRGGTEEILFTRPDGQITMEL